MPTGDISAARWERYQRDRKAGRPRMVSQGDSWFDYPQHRNVVDDLVVTGRYAILRFEWSGARLRELVEPATLGLVRQWVRSERPSAVLWSGGGNDLFDPSVADPKQRWIWDAIRPAAEVPPGAQDDPGAWLRSDRWAAKLDDLRGGYARVAATLGPDAPVFVHGYDYLPVTGRPAAYDGVVFIGPWIKPAMDDRRVPDTAVRRAIVARLIDDFNAALATLARERPLDVVYVDARHAVGTDDQWLNEIHPTPAGFQRVAERFDAALRDRLPGLLAERARRPRPALA